MAQLDSPAYDAVIVGGSFAGLSAALFLARGLRRVLVFNDGAPRNAVSQATRGLLTHDGASPSSLVHLAQQELQRYGVEVRTRRIVRVEGYDRNFTVTDEAGVRVTSAKLLLATGVRDMLPPISGFSELWGTRVHHCLYCNGYEYRQKAMALYIPTPTAYMTALAYHRISSDLVLATDGAVAFTPDESAELARRGIRILESPLVSLTATTRGLRLSFANGQGVDRDVLFHAPPVEQRSALAWQLGCARAQGGDAVRVDAEGMTSIPGVYAAGDMAGGARHHVTSAIESGARAAVYLAHTLVLQEASRQLA